MNSYWFSISRSKGLKLTIYSSKNASHQPTPPSFACINVNEAFCRKWDSCHNNLQDPNSPNLESGSHFRGLHQFRTETCSWGGVGLGVQRRSPRGGYRFSMKENFSNRNSHFVMSLIGAEKRITWARPSQSRRGWRAGGDVCSQEKSNNYPPKWGKCAVPEALIQFAVTICDPAHSLLTLWLTLSVAQWLHNILEQGDRS